jgi:amino acid transporter
MTTTTFILFIIVFLLPSIYQRGRYALQPEHFLKISLRKKVGLQIHHAHWGLIYILISSFWLIFADKNMYIILLAALGWGLLFDEIIPHLKMPSNDRILELEVYKKSTKPTIILIGIVIVILIILFLATR